MMREWARRRQQTQRQTARWALCGGLVLVLVGLCAALGVTSSVSADTQFRVRVLVAVPDTNGLDVWIDNNQLTANAAFRTLSAYKSYTPGNYTLRVNPPGSTTRASAYGDTTFRFESPKDYTIVVRGKRSDNSTLVTVEVDRNAQDANNVRLRYGNEAPGLGQTTLALSGSNTVLGQALFAETADYTTFASGTYELYVNDSAGKLLTKGTVTLAANTVVSVFLLGAGGGTGTAAPALLVNVDNPTTGLVTVSSGTATPPPTYTPAPIFTTTPNFNTTLQVAPAPASRASTTLRTALAPVPAVANTDSKVFYAATGHTLGGVFKTYWDSHGGLEQFGYPITEEYQEVSATDGKTYTTQYFERARFEDHTDKAGTPYEVQQGLLGRELIKMLGAG